MATGRRQDAQVLCPDWAGSNAVSPVPWPSHDVIALCMASPGLFLLGESCPLVVTTGLHSPNNVQKSAQSCWGLHNREHCWMATVRSGPWGRRSTEGHLACVCTAGSGDPQTSLIFEGLAGSRGWGSKTCHLPPHLPEWARPWWSHDSASPCL